MSRTRSGRKYYLDEAPTFGARVLDAMLDELTQLLARRVAIRILQDEQEGELPDDADPAE